MWNLKRNIPVHRSFSSSFKTFMGRVSRTPSETPEDDLWLQYIEIDVFLNKLFKVKNWHPTLLMVSAKYAFRHSMEVLLFLFHSPLPSIACCCPALYRLEPKSAALQVICINCINLSSLSYPSWGLRTTIPTITSYSRPSVEFLALQRRNSRWTFRWMDIFWCWHRPECGLGSTQSLNLADKLNYSFHGPLYSFVGGRGWVIRHLLTTRHSLQIIILQI